MRVQPATTAGMLVEDFDWESCSPTIVVRSSRRSVAVSSAPKLLVVIDEAEATLSPWSDLPADYPAGRPPHAVAPGQAGAARGDCASIVGNCHGLLPPLLLRRQAPLVVAAF